MGELFFAAVVFFVDLNLLGGCERGASPNLLVFAGCITAAIMYLVDRITEAPKNR
jgi:hypothetical protein